MRASLATSLVGSRGGRKGRKIRNDVKRAVWVTIKNDQATAFKGVNCKNGKFTPTLWR
jgi:hypothetical protein